MTGMLPPGFRIQRETNTEEFFINMGPQHPSTHGALRLALRMDGETIVELVPHFGYIHRGMEKQAESMSYLQYIALSDRQDYLTAIQNNLGVVIALEKGMNIGVPEKAEYIRVMLQELGRIASHLVFFACFGGDLGGQTCLLYGFKEREMIHDILEEVTGSRLTTNFFRPGGSRYDVPDTFIPRVKAFLDHMDDTMKDYERFLSKNIIVLERSKGILSKEDAIAYGCSGPVLRASGVNFDVRRANPYSIYDSFDFEVPVTYNGDCYDRYTVRIAEIHESMKILRQCIDRFPTEGPWRSKEKPVRLPVGRYYSEIETAKGLYATYVVAATTGEKPYRIHTRGPSFPHIAALNKMVQGYKISDLVTILATLDPVIPEIDR